MFLPMAAFSNIQVPSSLDESFCRRTVIKNAYWEEIRWIIDYKPSSQELCSYKNKQPVKVCPLT